MAKVVSKEIKEMFVNAETIGELRKAYLEATLKYNTPKILERVNKLYIDKFDAVKNVRRSSKGKIYEKPTKETCSFFLNAVNVLKGLEGRHPFHSQLQIALVTGKEDREGCQGYVSGHNL